MFVCCVIVCCSVLYGLGRKCASQGTGTTGHGVDTRAAADETDLQTVVRSRKSCSSDFAKMCVRGRPKRENKRQNVKTSADCEVLEEKGFDLLCAPAWEESEEPRQDP